MTENQTNQTCNSQDESCKPACSEQKKCCKGKKIVRCLLLTGLVISIVVLVYTLI